MRELSILTGVTPQEHPATPQCSQGRSSAVRDTDVTALHGWPGGASSRPVAGRPRVHRSCLRPATPPSEGSQENRMPKVAMPRFVFMAGVAQALGQSSGNRGRPCGAGVLLPAQAGDEGPGTELMEQLLRPSPHTEHPARWQASSRDARGLVWAAPFRGKRTWTPGPRPSKARPCQSTGLGPSARP